MDIHQLRIFATVYAKRSFTKASAQLNITQPTISEHISNLEKELERRLFDRLGRSIMPTPEAEILYPRALQIIESLENIQEDFSASDGRLQGKIIIGASTIPGTYLLPGLALQFKEQNPRVSFEIPMADSAEITEMVLNHELLCGLVGAVMDNKKLVYHPFVEDELVLVAAPESGLRNLRKKQEIYSMSFLNREKGSGTRKTMEHYFQKAGINPDGLNIAAVFGSTASIKEALKAGLGASILSRFAVREEIKNGQLKEIKIPGLKMKRNFHLIQHRKRTLPRHYQAFCDYLKETVSMG